MDSTHKEIMKGTVIEHTGDELGPITRIRTETVLSRLPIHNLANKGRVNIQIVNKNSDGDVTLKWEVSHSDRYGQPRQIAYKLDTIIINRRIDAQKRPLPKMICLGSLREIANELELGGDTNQVRRALRQNAFAAITAKLTYRTVDGLERQLEADFTRYGVVFLGEELPDGRRADAVYIILNEPYREVLNNAPVRPLNYEYLKVLPPAAQRFYEIVSYRIFAVLKTRGSEAKISYSEYCTFSAQQHYFDYDHFKKQMYKVHRLHLQSGYLKTIRYTPTTDAEGNADWMMHYTPGPRAEAEFRAFSSRKADHNFSEVNQEITREMGEWKPKPGTGYPKKRFAAGAPSQKAIDLVRYFHQQMRGIEDYALPQGGKEGSQADDLLNAYGEEAVRFIVNYGLRQAERTHFKMRLFGALMQYVPDAMAAFENRKSALATTASREQAEGERKREHERVYEEGRKALAALSQEARETLYAEVKADFLRRWPRTAGNGESQFLERIIETSMISRLRGITPSEDSQVA